MRDRFVICRNPEAAERDRAIRENLLAQLAAAIDGSDRPSTTARVDLATGLPAWLGRFLRRTPGGLLRVDRATVRAEERLDGSFLAGAPATPPCPRADIGAGLQASPRNRTWLAGHEVHPRTAPRVSPPRAPHPRPCRVVLARPAADPCRRASPRRHVAEPASRTRPDAPGHLHRARRHRPAPHCHHRRPNHHPPGLGLAEPPEFSDLHAPAPQPPD
jgi:hypothetical protein